MDLRPRSILLIEDNSDDEQLTMRAMRMNEFPTIVRVAHDGAEALEILFELAPGVGLPDLILLDIKLPKISGIEVLQRIRDHESTRYLPVVVLTSSDEDKDIVDCYRFGCNSYIRKPVDFEEFAECVGQLGLYWLGINRTTA